MLILSNFYKSSRSFVSSSVKFRTLHGLMTRSGMGILISLRLSREGCWEGKTWPWQCPLKSPLHIDMDAQFLITIPCKNPNLQAEATEHTLVATGEVALTFPQNADVHLGKTSTDLKPGITTRLKLIRARQNWEGRNGSKRNLRVHVDSKSDTDSRTWQPWKACIYVLFAMKQRWNSAFLEGSRYRHGRRTNILFINKKILVGWRKTIQLLKGMTLQGKIKITNKAQSLAYW